MSGMLSVMGTNGREMQSAFTLCSAARPYCAFTHDHCADLVVYAAYKHMHRHVPSRFTSSPPFAAARNAQRDWR